jgi:hypothetical protein
MRKMLASHTFAERVANMLIAQALTLAHRRRGRRGAVRFRRGRGLIAEWQSAAEGS